MCPSLPITKASAGTLSPTETVRAVFSFEAAFAASPKIDPSLLIPLELSRPQFSRWTTRREYGTVEYRPRDWVARTDLDSLEKIGDIENFQPSSHDAQALDGYIGISEATTLAGEEVGRGAVLRALGQANTRELKINAVKYGPPPADDLKACRLWRACFPGADKASKYELHNRGASNWGRSSATKFPDMGPGIFYGVAKVGHHSDQYLDIRCCYDTKVPRPGDYYRVGNVLDWRHHVKDGDTIYSDVAVGQDGGFVFSTTLADCYMGMIDDGRNVVFKWDLHYNVRDDLWGVVRKNLLHNDEVTIAVGPDVPENVSIMSALCELRGIQVEANRTRNDNIWYGCVDFTGFAYGSYVALQSYAVGSTPKSTMPSHRTANIASIVNKRRAADVRGIALSMAPIPRPPVIMPLCTRARILQNFVVKTNKWRAEFCEMAWGEGHAPFYDQTVGWVVRPSSAPLPPFDIQAYLDFVSPSMQGTDVTGARLEYDGYLSE